MTSKGTSCKNFVQKHEIIYVILKIELALIMEIFVSDVAPLLLEMN